MRSTQCRSRLLLVAIIVLFVMGTAGVVAQTATQSGEEPNDAIENATSIELGEEGATATGKLQSGDDSDAFNFSLEKDRPINVTVSAPEELKNSLSLTFMRRHNGRVQKEFAIPYDHVRGGESITYTITKEEYPLFETTAGRYTLHLLPVDPSSPTNTDEQAKAVGPYTITVTPINAPDSSLTQTATPTETSSQLPNTLSIRSTGDERVYYNATVSDSVATGTGADLEGAEQPDTVGETTASGSTAQGGVDNFTFSGELTALDLRGGPATVLVNGEQVYPDSFAATPTPTTTPTPTPTATPSPTPTATATPTSTPTATPTVTPTPTPRPTTTAETATSQLTTQPLTTSTATATGVSSPVSSSETTSSAGGLLTTATDTNSSGESTGFGPGFGVPIVLAVVLATGFLVSRRVR
jgi:hypothetical protein